MPLACPVEAHVCQLERLITVALFNPVVDIGANLTACQIAVTTQVGAGLPEPLYARLNDRSRKSRECKLLRGVHKLDWKRGRRDCGMKAHSDVNVIGNEGYLDQAKSKRR